MYVAVTLCPVEHIHVKMISVFVACKHINRGIRLILRDLSTERIAVHPVSRKPVKNQNRNVDVSLTALGEQAAVEAEQARAELADHVFGALQEEEKMQLETILLKLSQTLPSPCPNKGA